ERRMQDVAKRKLKAPALLRAVYDVGMGQRAYRRSVRKRLTAIAPRIGVGARSVGNETFFQEESDIMRIQARFAVLLGLALLALAPLTSQADSFHVTNLVSNIEGMALITDPLLEEAWGVSYGGPRPFRVSICSTGTGRL